MLKTLFCATLLSITSLHSAVLHEDYTPQEKENEGALAQQVATVNPTITGIVLISSCDKMLPPEEAKKVKGIKNVDVVLPNGTYRLEDHLYHKVLNAPFCKAWLEEVKREVMAYYKDCKRPFMIVEIPEQDITDGVVQLVVKEGKIGKISCTGNKYYPKEYFADLLGLREGQQILYDVLSESVAWLGMRPFSQAELIFKPGEKEGEVDIEIIARADNSGTKATSYGRVFAGAVIDNIFKSGGVLTYNYKASWDFEKLQSNLLAYAVPLSCGHILSTYGGYATVHPEIRHFHSEGYYAQASFAYSIPLKWRLCQWANNIGFGLNFKRLNNNVLFVDNPKTPIVDGTVNVTQLLVSYQKGKHYKNHSVSFSSTLIVSPGDIIGEESNHDYNKLQHGAKSTYAYTSLGGEFILYLPHEVSLTLRGSGQAATGTLLPSEQFSLGGVQNVRGYDPGEYLADNGAAFSTEVFSPPINFKIHKTRGYLMFLGFLDAAVGNQYNPLSGTRKTDYLIGVGPGMRYKIDPFLEVDFDWGIKMHKVKGGSGTDQRFYFSVTASY